MWPHVAWVSELSVESIGGDWFSKGLRRVRFGGAHAHMRDSFGYGVTQK
jgi:hypothetical protein